jgi:hypothetical protein
MRERASRAAIQEVLRVQRAKPRSTNARVIWRWWSGSGNAPQQSVTFVVNGGQPAIRGSMLSLRSATSV